MKLRTTLAASVLALSTAGALAFPATAQAAEQATPQTTLQATALAHAAAGTLGASLIPVVTHPVIAPIDVPAGAVCSFGVHVAFPTLDLTRYTWSNSNGRAVFAIETGTMIATFTHTATGETVTRDLSGTGYYAYPDANTLILSGTRIAVFDGAGDSPANELLFAGGGFMSVEAVTANGVTTKTVLVQSPQAEDLCQTL